MLRKLTLMGICLSLLAAAPAWAELVDNGDGTVTDTNTGLMWQQDEAGAMTWAKALTYCESLSLSVYDDWRLPNRNELQSLVDYTRYAPAIDKAIFRNAVSSGYWSSTTYSNDPVNAWGVSFHFGYISNCNKSDNRYYVRAVRGGQ
jgi:hypothetical protein